MRADAALRTMVFLRDGELVLSGSAIVGTCVLFEPSRGGRCAVGLDHVSLTSQQPVLAAEVPPSGDPGNQTILVRNQATDTVAGSSMDAMMRGALGSYDMTREASGTSWQPDTSVHAGIHAVEGEWMLMVHALLDAVYD